MGALRAAGARLCVGIDSHVITDPFEDMRGVELGEPLRTGRRVTLRGEGGATPAEVLWEIGSQRGAEACGFADPGGSISVRRDAPALAMVREERLLDAVMYSGSPVIVEG
ncbi:hypothetical protein WMF11_05315 [Sorangium sp. So ce295]|uniref:hypothetical protein n=1 Tax=Sorangium sp. So ce295 TaxID=3133295 RepID=UPI003F640587